MKNILTLNMCLFMCLNSFSQNWSVGGGVGATRSYFELLKESTEPVISEPFSNYSYDIDGGIQFSKRFFISRLELGGEYFNVDYNVKKRRLFTYQDGFTEFNEGLIYQADVFSAKIMASAGFTIFPSSDWIDVRFLYGISYQYDVRTSIKTNWSFDEYWNVYSGQPSVNDILYSTGEASDELVVNKNSIRQNLRLELMTNLNDQFTIGVYAGGEFDFLDRLRYSDVLEKFSLVLGVRVEKQVSWKKKPSPRN